MWFTVGHVSKYSTQFVQNDFDVPPDNLLETHKIIGNKILYHLL